MNALRFGVAVMGIVFAFTAVGEEAAMEKETLTPSAAYDFFKGLEGDWSAKTVTVPVGTKKEDGVENESEISYETVANGATVMGTYYKGSPMQMIDMIHQDGPDALRLTHYCAVGNQPRMKMAKSDEPGVIQFKFDGGSNMDIERDGHVHEAKIRIIDEDHFEVETQLWSGGEHAMTTYFSISRKED